MQIHVSKNTHFAVSYASDCVCQKLHHRHKNFHFALRHESPLPERCSWLVAPLLARVFGFRFERPSTRFVIRIGHESRRVHWLAGEWATKVFCYIQRWQNFAWITPLDESSVINAWNLLWSSWTEQSGCHTIPRDEFKLLRDLVNVFSLERKKKLSELFSSLTHENLKRRRCFIALELFFRS